MTTRQLLRRLVFTFFMAVPALSAWSQAPLGPGLREALRQDPGPASFRVLIQLESAVDLPAMTQAFRQAHTPAPQRWRHTIRALQQDAQTRQSILISDLAVMDLQLRDPQKFWICNAIVAELDREAFPYLSSHHLVQYVELESAWLSQPIELPRPEPVDQRSQGAPEAGLLAIKADKLWAKGYTGKGRLSMSLDTGVWTEHPAIGDRFFGNFFPLSQSWYGLDFVTPIDKAGSHGTHTLGTALGLEKATNDTIGMAFNAYWIASDVVATSLATVHPLSDFMLAFQWAMDPDGDTTTVWDVPDAINNSWGFVIPTDTNMCTSTVSMTFDALEAAGIANVFSAGNDGPAFGTVNYPNHVSNGLVNTFTVGALDGNNPNYTIASFSSRGPTICPRSGSILIKPEVSAPGVNVRSSVGKGSYAAYSGTSMAAPHSTGAVLLLKEAFPNVSGDEILLALYYSAIDLGDPGEDNTYGMGMIDVEAAFNYLAQSYTPTPPDTAQWDLAIAEVVQPSLSLLCDSLISPSISVENRGLNTIQNLTFDYRINTGPWASASFSANLAAGQKDTFNFSPLGGLIQGQNEFYIEAHASPAVTESDTVNNRRFFRFWKQGEFALPWSEDFENVDLNNSDWHIINEDAEITWDTFPAGGIPGSVHSAYMDFPDYLPKIHQKDELLSPELIVPDSGQITLTFKVAYQHRHNILSDSLQVWLSPDCGQSWTDRVYFKGGATLSTHDTVIQKFVPSRPSHWRTDTVDLSQFAGLKRIMLKWVGVNDHGNYLFLDDINISSGPFVGRGPEPAAPQLEVWPNPVDDRLQLSLSGWQGGELNIRAHAATGRLVGEWSLPAGAPSQMEIPTGEWPAGVYLLQVCGSGNCQTRKIVKYR